MPKFIKKPVQITAIQYQWDDEFLSMDEAQANIAHFVGGRVAYLDQSILLDGAHGQSEVNRGDWVIRQSDEDFYPCSDETFQAIYAPCETFLDRLKIERDEVQTRLDGLNKTLDVPTKPEFISEAQWISMSRQQFHQRQYVQILNERIAGAEGEPVTLPKANRKKKTADNSYRIDQPQTGSEADLT